jgi:molybdopterin-guanine dinucleotide biosynthesis protein B
VTRIFAISGYSGTGKTTLVEAIIEKLVERGYSVASVKSSKHTPSEEEGTDTWRHKHAGAGLTIFWGPEGVQVDGSRHDNLRDVLTGIEYDYLIVEGMKSSQIPKIWCIGNNELKEGEIPPRTVAIFAWQSMDTTEEMGLPVLYTTDMAEIVQIVVDNAEDMQTITGI